LWKKERARGRKEIIEERKLKKEREKWKSRTMIGQIN